MRHTYAVVLRKEPEGGYTVLVPALPGCLTCGDTVAEALRMARDVIPLFIQTLRDLGKPIPRDQSQVRVDMTKTRKALVHRLTFAARDLGVDEEIAVA